MSRHQKGPGLFTLFLAGVAAAYLVTGFWDRPRPIHFSSGNEKSTPQSAARENDQQLVLRKNIFKLGDPLTIQLMVPKGAASESESWEFKGEVDAPEPSRQAVQP